MTCHGNVIQEHRQQAHVAGKLSARESFRNLKRWELLRVFWGADEEQKKIKRLEVELS
jgi:hypothetical protein